MKDRFTRGLAAGTAGGIVNNLAGLVSFNLINITGLRFMDYAAVMLYGRKSENIPELLFAAVGQIAFSALLGVIFVYLLPVISSTYLYLKSWFYSITVWFAVYALTVLFRVPEVAEITLNTAVSNFIVASLYGLVLAATLSWFEQRVTG